VTDSPIPEPPDPNDRVAARRALVWTSTAIAMATAFLFVFNAASMKSWSASLTPTETTAKLVSLTSAWDDEMTKFGLTGPRAWLHDVWGQQRARTWDRAAPGAGQGPPPG
jgi:hypothetical protein